MMNLWSRLREAANCAAEVCSIEFISPILRSRVLLRFWRLKGFALKERRGLDVTLTKSTERSPIGCTRIFRDLPSSRSSNRILYHLIRTPL